MTWSAPGPGGYRPRWLRGLAAVRAEHGDRLAALVGRRLSRAWVVWDQEDDEWFCDYPVVLDFDGVHIEITHRKFDELSITWNTLGVGRAVRWAVPGFDLAWRDDAPAELAALKGRTLHGVELLVWAGGDVANGLVDLGFDFGATGYLTVFNAMDENGLDFTGPDSRQRRHPPH